jgi:hypothetical protein
MRQALSRSVASLAAILRDRARLDELEAAFYADFTAVRQYAPLARFERGDRERASFLALIGALLIPLHAIVREPVTPASPAARQALSALHESAAEWLSALSTSILDKSELPPLRRPDAAVATLERTIDGVAEPPETRRRLRLQVDWFALVRTQLEQIARGAPA